MKIATTAYAIERIGSEAAYRDKVTRICEEAAREGARILLLPEYAPVELTALRLAGDVRAQLDALQHALPLYLETHAALARRLGVVIVAGSFPQRMPDGSYRNRAHVFGPRDEGGAQEKLHMTRWETETWQMHPGQGIRVFDAFGIRFGVNICLDVELGAQARRQAEEGAELLLVPSCTDTLHGWHRVRAGALARALENQCFVAVAPVVGTTDWSEALDSNVGAAGIFAPMEEGFPCDGVVAAGTLNAPGWAYADLDFERLRAVREHGVVQTFLKGGDTRALLETPVEAVALS